MTFVVTTTADETGACDASCSLREAMTEANANAGADTIEFDIAGSGVHTIAPTSGLPSITDGVTIDGTTESDYVPGGAPRIEVNGASVGSVGFSVSAPNTTIRGLTINRFGGTGIFVAAAASTTTIEANYVGLDATGTLAAGNGNGISVFSSNNTIGGSTADERNVVSGNPGSAIVLGGGSNTVQGNYVGTSADGLSSLGNLEGVGVISSGNTIGGPDPGEGNVLSGSTTPSGAGAGVSFSNSAASNTVEGNLIGTNKDGTAAIPNSRRGIYVGSDAGANNVIRGNVISGNSGDGVDLFGNSVTVHGNLIGTNGAGTAALANTGFGIQTSGSGSGNVIGGTTATAGNVISGNNIGLAIGSSNNQVFGNSIGTTAGGASLPNQFDGIVIASGNGSVIGGEGSGEPNRIRNNGGDGVQTYSSAGTGNRVSANEIANNGGQGIDLNMDGVTPNDAGDGDTGPNNLQNFPVLTSATGGASTSVDGSLDTAAGTYRVEFFANTACDGTHGEGARFLGGRSVPPGPFSATGLGATSAGEVVTATATDASGNTSEFSACQALGGGGGTLIVQNTNDSGAGSLRQAIIDANAAAGHDEIQFDLDNKTISLLSPLPAITDPVDIHGISLQTGNVILDGTSAGDADGLVLGPGSGGSTIEDLEIRAFSKVFDDSAAIRVSSGQNVLEGNLLHDVDVGVLVTGAAATQNVIGGDSSSGEGNTIWSYVFEGIRVEAAGSGNRLSGNTVGRPPTGPPAGGVTGVRVVDTPGTAIAALTVDAPGNPPHVPGPGELFSVDFDLGNVIVDSGEFGEGIRVEGAASTGTVVAGNFIGTDRSAVPPNVGNGGNGIEVAGAANNQLGPGNTVWFNDENGVLVSNASGNRIVANSINANGGGGISLSTANGDLAAPDLGFATTANITGVVDGVPGRDYFLELFSNDSCTGAQGKTFVGFLTVQDGAFDQGVTLTDGASITATVTDSVTNDTSEFSNCVVVSGGGGGAVDPPVLFAAVPDATPSALGIAGLVEEAGLPSGSSFQVQFYSSPQCNSPSPTALGARTVTTNANGVAAFALEGFPNVADGTAVRATASRGGPPSGFSNCVIADPNNTSWPTALAVPATSTRTGFLRDQGQARWFKVPILPNSHVDLRLSGLPADYDMVVFGDVEAAYDELVGGTGYVPSAGPNLALDDLNRQGADAPADVFNTSQYNPSAWDPTNWDPTLNTANYSPSQWSPSQWSPSQWSASQWSPSQWSPSQWSPSQWSPSQWSPSQWSPSQWSSSNPADPSAFSTAQTSTVLAVSGGTGSGDENVSVNTWNNTGFLYVRVQGKNGIFDPDDEFTLDVSRSGSLCAGVADQSSSPTAPATNRRTLILVDGSRMSIDAALSGKLNQLAARPEVQGAVVNVASDPVVTSLNAQADTKKACPYAKNLVASAITRIVNAYRATNPLEYVVVVGDDSVIPFYRYPDPALLGNEKLYVPPVRDDTASQASLRLGFVLNQDGYGSSGSVSLHGNAFPVPDLAVGRLVETPTEVEGMLDAYLGTAGGVVPTPTSSLTTGYDFLQDAADVVAGHLSSGIGGSNNATLITNRTISPETVTVGTSPDRNHSWTGADLRRSLLTSGRHDLIFLAGHFSANDALGADYKTNVLSTELPASSTSFVNSIVFSAGCHAGYNIVNGDATTWTEPLDWAQAFARKRATLISGTGYQYGDTDFLAHSERIYAEFARQLRVTTGAGGAPVPVSVGRALLRSKQIFLETTPGLTALDEKALLQATLFGLPMLSVNLPQGRIVEAPDTTVVPGITPVGPGPGAALGLGFADLGVGPSLAPQSLQLKSGPLATWLSGPDGVAVRPTQPILPLDSLNVTSPSPTQALRGVAFRGGSYTDTLNVTPLTAASATELRGVHAPFFTDVFFPTQPWTVNFFGALAGGATRLHATPVQHRSSLGGDLTKSTRRRFSNLDLRLFYSGNTSSYCPGTSPLALAPCPGGVAVAPALAAPPTITGVETGFDTNTRVLTFKARILGELVAGIQAAWVTWTIPPAAGQPGTWQSLDLQPDADEPVLWTGTMTLTAGVNPANVRFVVQAVNGVGRVKIDDNVGAFYQPGSIPGQTEPGAGAPAPTAITFTTAPPSSVAFGSSFTVTTRLASGGVPVSGELVRIGFGAAGVPDSTNGSGEASVSLSASLSPGTYLVTASFAGDATHAPSDVVQSVQVTKRPTTLTLSGTLLSSNPLTATLTADAVPGSAVTALTQRNVFLVITGGPLTQVYSAKTDPKGRVELPQSLLATLPPRIYTVHAYFNGATLPGPVQVDPDDVDYAHAEDHQTIDSWLGAAFSGFVGMSNPPSFNSAKAGTAVPIKFSLGANRGLAIFAAGYPKVGTVPCNNPNATPTGLVAADSNGLRIDSKNNQYTWDWKTGSWKGTCRALIVRFGDGTEKKLLFRF